MIIFREKNYSFMNSVMVLKLTNNLDRDRIDSYDVSERIPDDSISITTDLDSLEIYIPEDYEYSQYGIDNSIRRISPSIRTSVEYVDNKMYKMTCRGKFRFDQYYKLVKYIIEEEGYCVIIDLI